MIYYPSLNSSIFTVTSLIVHMYCVKAIKSFASRSQPPIPVFGTILSYACRYCTHNYYKINVATTGCHAFTQI